MPRGNGTGPMGMGSMTGRGAGYCSGNKASGFATAGRGAGSWSGPGMGFAKGRCWGAQNMYSRGGMGYGKLGAMSPDLEKTALTSQADVLQRELDMIRKRLDDMEKNRQE